VCDGCNVYNGCDGRDGCGSGSGCVMAVALWWLWLCDGCGCVMLMAV
jgi:hypothetical protein